MRETISKLCDLINILNDAGCITQEESKEYMSIMKRQSKIDVKVKEIIETLKLMKAEIEWEYPMEYQVILEYLISILTYNEGE